MVFENKKRSFNNEVEAEIKIKIKQINLKKNIPVV